MFTQLPCCFKVFYNYPSWRTEGSPFVPQVPGYLKTHIIHSFLTILNYKTLCTCRSAIMDIPPVPNLPKTFKFPQRSFGQKNPVKEVFSLHGSQIECGYITNDHVYFHVCMVAYRDGKLNRSNLDKSFILNGFSNCSRCHRDWVRGRNSCVQYICVVRCSNITIIRNISFNIPAKLTEFINQNCTQDAIKTHLQPFWT